MSTACAVGTDAGGGTWDGAGADADGGGCAGAAADGEGAVAAGCAAADAGVDVLGGGVDVEPEQAARHRATTAGTAPRNRTCVMSILV
jgi:hypothetical protein